MEPVTTDRRSERWVKLGLPEKVEGPVSGGSIFLSLRALEGTTALPGYSPSPTILPGPSPAPHAPEPVQFSLSLYVSEPGARFSSFQYCAHLKRVIARQFHELHNLGHRTPDHSVVDTLSGDCCRSEGKIGAPTRVQLQNLLVQIYPGPAEVRHTYQNV